MVSSVDQFTFSSSDVPTLDTVLDMSAAPTMVIVFALCSRNRATKRVSRSDLSALARPPSRKHVGGGGDGVPSLGRNMVHLDSDAIGIFAEK